MEMQQDPVCRYLQLQGHALRPAWFQNTGYRLGWEFSTRFYSMTWRREGNILLICDIQAVQDTRGLESAVGALIHLWRDIIISIKEVTEIRGMIANYGSPRQKQLRRKMKDILLRQGAKTVTIKGEPWLVYTGK